LGVNNHQGYLYSKPITSTAFNSFLEKNKTLCREVS